MTSLAYKPACEEVVGRLRRLYERQGGDRILATMAVPSAVLEEFARQHPRPQCEYPEPARRAAFWDELLRERTAVEDDSMPCAYLSEFDQGLYGGLLGGDVRFLCHADSGWISSMVPPLLDDWSQLDGLCTHQAHPWWQRYLRQLDVFAKCSRGKWGISHFILIDGLNFVFELIGGTRTYLSLADEPEMVRRAIDLGFELNVKVQRAFFERVPALGGGTFSNFAQWLPGRIVSESLDPFHMTSVDCFETWGREPVERILSQFDGGVIHLHGNGRHLLEAASTIEGLRAILLLDDRGFPKAFDVLGQLKAHTGSMPLGCYATYPSFAARLAAHALPGGVIYHVTDVPDVDTANRCMEQVRAYRA